MEEAEFDEMGVENEEGDDTEEDDESCAVGMVDNPIWKNSSRRLLR